MSNNQNYQSKQIVKTWFERAKKGNKLYNYFDRFISLWVSFNCFFVSEFYKTAKNDSGAREPSEKDYLRIIYTEKNYKNKYSELLNQNKKFKDELNTFFKYLNGSGYITHFKGKVADMRPNRRTEINAQSFENLNNFKQFILVVYQIRCNLFHGNKNPDANGDIKLVESIFKSFIIFIEEIYRMEGYLC